MKNISKAVSGAGFLVSGVLLLCNYMELTYKLRMIGLIMSIVFIVAGIILAVAANASVNNDNK